MMTEPVCYMCRYFHADKPGHECDAFKEIPEEILLGENNHSKPLPGQDSDIVYVLSDEAKKLL